MPHPSVQHYEKLTVSPGFGADGSLKLREYQLEGVSWLLWNWYNRRPSILADEMGLVGQVHAMWVLEYSFDMLAG